MNHTISAIAAVACLVFTTGCDKPSSSESSGPEVRSTQLALNWYPEAEHGGFVAADELSIFADRGLEVEILPGGPGAPNLVIQELAAGRIDFAISNADQVVIARSKGIPLVAVLAPLQQSPRCIIVHESSGIESLQELADVELAISENRPFAMWMKNQLPLTNVSMVPYNGMVGEFLARDDFAQQGYVFSEPFVAAEKGGDPKVLMLSEIGFNPYASLLVTSEDMIKSNPDLVRDVVQCCQTGWEAYLENPTATNARLHQDNPDLSLDALTFAVDALRPLYEPVEGENHYEMSTQRWKQLIDQIEQVGGIEPDTVTAEECFSLRFLDLVSDTTTENR